MNARVIPRTALEGSLKLARMPLDVAVGLLPGNGTGAATAAKLAIYRIDASIRSVFASVLGDPVLRDDAQRRYEAAEERQRALRLRGEAARTSDRADSRLEERHEQVERQRRQAQERAQAKTKEAAKRRKAKVYRAAKAERERLSANRKAGARTKEAIESSARKQRLDALDAKSDALREKEEQLTASDEAERLAQAAARTKARRKRS